MRPASVDRVMGRPEGPRGDRSRAREESRRAVDARHFEHLFEGHVRQDGRQAPGEHRLPRPRRPDEKDIVGTGRGHLEGPLDVLLALDVLEVDRVDRRGDELVLIEAAGRDRARFAEKADDADEVLEGEDLELADEGRLAGVRPGHDDPSKAGPPGHQGDGQDAAHGLETSVEGQLADEEIVAQALAPGRPRGRPGTRGRWAGRRPSLPCACRRGPG